MNSGYWRAFRNMVGGKPICGMSSTRNDGASFMIKYFSGDTYLTGHVMKASWRFPEDGSKIDIPLTIGVDRNAILNGNAIGYVQHVTGNDGRRYPLQTLEFYITPQKTSIDQFLIDFAAAKQFWLRFDEGSERPWVLDMTGSAKVALTFRTCALELIRVSKGGTAPTQPYGGATQPYGKPQATQPYRNQQPTQQPRQRDDGGI